MGSIFLLTLATGAAFVATGIRPVGARHAPIREKGPSAGEEREFEIANGVKMKFCWIPSGEAQLGAPEAELEAAENQIMKLGLLNPALETETESGRVRYRTKGFWLGKYPVTQGEWVAVMGNNPSWFNTNDERTKSLDTSRFPVERVNWNDCHKFLDKVNGRGGVDRVFGGAGRFMLPREDQWEYACRGGKGNKHAYYWGDELNGTQANCYGKIPFGTATQGPYLGRTCSVDFTNEGKYPKHPWGLCHMVGNVAQWCDDEHENSGDRYVRGGGWECDARNCRSAARRWEDPVLMRYEGFGLRVCLRMEQ